MLRQNGDSSTCVIEPVELQNISQPLERPAEAKVGGRPSSLNIHQTPGSREVLTENNDPVEVLPSPTTAAAQKHEKWNTPRLNLWRTFAAFWSFIVMGSNDAAYGVCTSYINH